MEAWRPPYECPPKKILPDVSRRSAAAAARNPAWSFSALPRIGGPDGRACLNGKSHRNTVTPAAQNASAIVFTNGAWQLAPAPCVNTRQSESLPLALWRNPRTGASFTESS